MAADAAAATCARCGAARRADAPMYCTFCGAKQATGVADPAAYRTLPERYDLVARQPGYARAAEWRPRTSAVNELGGPLVMMVGIGGFMTGFLAIARVIAPPGFWWFGIGFAALALAIGLVGLVRGLLRVLAPPRCEVAVLAGERDDWAARSVGDGTAVVLRARDGATRRVLAGERLIGSLVAGDIGLAYTQRDRLVDYRWFDVMPPPVAAGEPPRAPGCTACGAPMEIESRTTCTFCGAALPDPDLGEHGAEFAALAASAAARTSLARTARGGLPPLTGPAWLLGVGAVAALGLWQLRGLVGFLMAEVSPLFALAVVPVVLVLGVGGLWLEHRTRPRREPYVRAPGLVLRHRRVKWGEVNGSPRYHYYVTVAFATGARRELRVVPDASDRIADHALGIAHVRGAWLVAFDAAPGATPQGV